MKHFCELPPLSRTSESGEQFECKECGRWYQVDYDAIGIPRWYHYISKKEWFYWLGGAIISAGVIYWTSPLISVPIVTGFLVYMYERFGRPQ